MTQEPTGLTGLVVDWGGVLTGPLDIAFDAWMQRDGVSPEHFRDLMRTWLGHRPPQVPISGVVLPSSQAAPAPGSSGPVADVEQSGAPDGGGSPVHLLERGELEPAEFERMVADELAARGSGVPASGMLERMLADLGDLRADMLYLVRQARSRGLRTALLSNSWGNTYPDELYDDLFDAVVISGEVGMRKPELRIYRYAAEQLGLPPSACVMVDDLPHNVHAAAEAGMVGVLHRTYDETRSELEVLFGLPLG